jgi:hypothetical protein
MYVMGSGKKMVPIFALGSEKFNGFECGAAFL